MPEKPTVTLKFPGHPPVTISDDKFDGATDRIAQGLKNAPRTGGVAVDQLKSIISRVEKLEEEKAAIATDIRDVFAEAKGNGFDTKAIRTILKMRKMDASEREEAETILDTYMHALGMLPLFEGLDE